MFEIRPFHGHNLSWWLANEANIDFDPDFQRTSRVWRGRDQAFLVDSVLNGFDIPKLYVADFSAHDVPDLNRKRKSYAIIDGKQRLTALLAFMRDKYPLAKSFVLHASPAQKLGGMTFTELKAANPAAAATLENYTLDVRAIVTDDRQKIHDVFRRLNEASKALNGAEKRNALIGEAVDAIRVISKHKLFATRIRFATDRSQEKNAAAKLLYLEYEGRSPRDTKKRQLDDFVVAVGAKGTKRFRDTVKRLNAGLATLCGVFQKNDPLLATQGSVPIYYLFITQLKNQQIKTARRFIEWFEAARTKNRNSRAGNKDFDSYDIANRSTNDAKSYTERLRVIRKKHVEWLRLTRRPGPR